MRPTYRFRQVKKILVLGMGFVGTKLASEFSQRSGVNVLALGRHQYSHGDKTQKFDVVINCAMPSARYKAKMDPIWDFEETVAKTAKFLNELRYERFIQVSSVSAVVQRDTPYGLHKHLAEQLVLSRENCCNVRLGPMFDNKLTKGVLIDLLAGKDVFLHPESRYAFSPLSYICAKIVDISFDSTVGSIDIGSKGFVRLQEVADFLDSRSSFKSSYLDDQIFPEAPADAPCATDVFNFLTQFQASI